VGKNRERHPKNAPGDWFVDRACIDCGASSSVAPGLIVARDGQRVFARQPEGALEERQAFLAMVVCPTASIRTGSRRTPPKDLMPDELAPGVFRCGYNAESSFGAHSYFAVREAGNLLVDSPRFLARLADFFAARGGLRHILLTHRDDVADAARYAAHFGARVWIHEDDADAAPFATDRLEGIDAREIDPGVLAIPVPGHTRGSVVFRLDGTYLFTGDSLAWHLQKQDVYAFRDACWYSWSAQADSLERLAAYEFEWILAGHGGSGRLPPAQMREALLALVARMRSRGTQ
jgi:glyoxylase-like metal-dependent hydrolase (beta-lactamase superfamily II)